MTALRDDRRAREAAAEIDAQAERIERLTAQVAKLTEHRNEWAAEAERHRLAVVALREKAGAVVRAAQDLSRVLESTEGDEVHGQ